MYTPTIIKVVIEQIGDHSLEDLCDLRDALDNELFARDKKTKEAMSLSQMLTMRSELTRQIDERVHEECSDKWEK